MPMRLMHRRGLLACAMALAVSPVTSAQPIVLPPAPPGVEISTEQGIEFVTIGDPSNPAYPGNEFLLNQGRGSVPYSFRLSRTELTTGQWLEFANNFTTVSSEIEQFITSQTGQWAAYTDFSYNGPGRRYIASETIPNSVQVPVEISWRMAAYYCNWLQNGRPTTWEAIQQGAYDATTFGEDTFRGGFTDQLTHSPGARYWIPTLDEWLKSVHYDPHRFGPGQGGGGWWNQPGGSNDELIPGAPGVGQTSAGWNDLAVLTLPVASYATVMTPWGLFDASGGLSEWTEEPVGNTLFPPDVYFTRVTDGSRSFPGSDFRRFDDAGFVDYRSPDRGSATLRIASSIPVPSSLIVFAVGASLLLHRKRNRP